MYWQEESADEIRAKWLSRCIRRAWFDIVTVRQISFGDWSSITENLRQLQIRMQKPLNEVKNNSVVCYLEGIWVEMCLWNHELKYNLWESHTTFKKMMTYSKVYWKSIIICRWEREKYWSWKAKIHSLAAGMTAKVNLKFIFTLIEVVVWNADRVKGVVTNHLKHHLPFV